MRVLLHSSAEDTLSARYNFLYKTFNVFFVQKAQCHSIVRSPYNFIVLQSIPTSFEADKCIVYGHNYEIHALLQERELFVTEENIFIISCEKHYRNSFRVNDRNTFLAPQQDEMASLRRGADYQLDFDVTDAELNLLNCKLPSAAEKLYAVFTRL